MTERPYIPEFHDWELLFDEDDLEWFARNKTRKEVELYVVDADISVYDDEQYYPTGSYSAPLAVIDALRALNSFRDKHL